MSYVVFLYVFVGLVFFDAPHGILPNTPWDISITKQWLVRIFKQVSASCTSEAWVTAIMHKTTDSLLVQEAMQEAGMSQMMNFYWLKQGHHTQTPVSSLTNVIEMGTIGYKPDRTKVGWKGASTDPRQRQNVVVSKPVTTFHKAEDGDIINPCQKPPDIIEWLGAMHVPPGGHVLVIGFGSGAELCGALEVGLNVVGIEADVRQFEAVKKVLVRQYQHEVDVAKKVTKELGEQVNTSTVSTPISSKEGVEEGKGEEEGDGFSEDEKEAWVCLICEAVIPKEIMDTSIRCHLGCRGYMHKQCAVMKNEVVYCSVKCRDSVGGLVAFDTTQETEIEVDIGGN